MQASAQYDRSAGPHHLMKFQEGIEEDLTGETFISVTDKGNREVLTVFAHLIVVIASRSRLM